MAQQQLTAELLGVLQSDWNNVTYTSYYDVGWCLNQNVTYGHRVNIADNFNYCSVPLSGSDAFLFAGMALLVASVCMGKLQSVWVLVAGGILGILNYEVNMYRLSNAISLWLGIQPPDLFFYAFLPPLLVDAALRLDWYFFTKLWPHITLLAYGMVLMNAAVLTPFILFALGFANRGWDWVHGAILAAMLAPTDAVAVTAFLKSGGGPEGMVVLLEGEALLNDASAVTLYTVFLGIMEHADPDSMPSVTSELWPIIKLILKLTGIGVGIGLAFAWALGYLLRLLRWRGVRPYIESLVVLSTAYLAFYVAQGPAKGSGVIAVVIFGLYGSATGHWGMLATDAESGIHEAVWDTVAFAANALVFFWSGISSVNFVARAAPQLSNNAWNYAAIPIIYAFMYLFRGGCMIAFMPIFKLLGHRVTLPETAFATVAGLRGSLTLIMIADFIIHSDFYTSQVVAQESIDVVLWASAFVLLSLLINAPAIGPVMRWTGLSRISPDKVRQRKKALEELSSFTAQSIDTLKQQQDGEFLQGANWELVAAFVNHAARLKGFVPRPRGRQPAGKQVSEDGDAGAAAALAAVSVAGEGEANGLASDHQQGQGQSASVPPLPGSKGGTPKAGKGKAGAAGGSKSPVSGGAGSRRGSWRTSFRIEEDGPDDYEVPFISSRSPAAGAAPPADRGSEEFRRALNVAALQAAARGGRSHPGSFYDPAAADAAGPAFSAAAVRQALGRSASGMARAGSGTGGGFASPTFGTGAVTPPGLRPGGTPAAGSIAPGEADEEEVETLFSQGDAGVDFDARWDHSVAQMSAATAAKGQSQQQQAAGAGPTAAAVQSQLKSAQASRAAAAAAGSERDLLGRLQKQGRGREADASADNSTAAASLEPSAHGGPSAHLPPPRGPSGKPTLVSAALLSRAPSKHVSKHLQLAGRTGGASAAGLSAASRDLEAGQPDGESPKAPAGGSSSEDGGESGEMGSLQELRLRVLHGVKRHFRAKRLAGLLSPNGLRVAIFACDAAIEHAEEHPSDPIRLWPLLEKEIRGTLVTRSLAGLLARTLRLHRAMPAWWRRFNAVPFRLFTGYLRRKLGSKMLIACEATVELYMGLAASPQIQWVYYGDDTPVAILEEVQEQLLGAYEFIQDREAEAPAQYHAVQSYRAAMAVLRQQRAFTADMYERGLVDEDEREMLAAAVDAAMRHLDMTGPIWRPPVPEQVVRSLDAFMSAPPPLTNMLMRQSELKEFRPAERVWASEEGAAAGGLYVVLSGVVRQEFVDAEGTTSLQQLRGVGSLFGDLAGLGDGVHLPGAELVVACGNSFGRGPLVCHFPPAALRSLHERAAGGDGAAAALEAELFRAAALHMMQQMQGDVQALVRSYLESHRPLGKYTSAGAAGQSRQMAERVARYSAQVLLDLLQSIPYAPLVHLRAGDSYRQACHVVLLQGLLEPAGGGEELQAPAVLPHITSHRFSFVAARAVQEQRREWQAGKGGATLLACSGGAAAAGER